MSEQKMQMEKANERVVLGREAFSRGQFTEAEKNFREAIALNPEHSDGWNGLASVLCEKNQGEWNEEAVECLMKAIKADAQNVKAWNNLADFYNRRGEVDQAIVYLEKCVALDGDNFMTHGNLGLAYRNMERFEEAVDSLIKALSLNNRCGWTGYQLGFTYMVRGLASGETQDLERARQVFQWMKDCWATLENLPAAHEVRLIESYLTMKINAQAVRVLLTQEAPNEIPSVIAGEQQALLN